jgi:hypothetical protein
MAPLDCASRPRGGVRRWAGTSGRRWCTTGPLPAPCATVHALFRLGVGAVLAATWSGPPRVRPHDDVTVRDDARPPVLSGGKRIWRSSATTAPAGHRGRRPAGARRDDRRLGLTSDGPAHRTWPVRGTRSGASTPAADDPPGASPCSTIDVPVSGHPVPGRAGPHAPDQPPPLSRQAQQNASWSGPVPRHPVPRYAWSCMAIRWKCTW